MSNPKDRSPATHRDPKEISIDLHGSIVCGGVFIIFLLSYGALIFMAMVNFTT